MSIAELDRINEKECSCGKIHSFPIDQILIGKGVIAKIPEIVKGYGAKKVFVLSDPNTYEAAGAAVVKLLEENEIPYSSYIMSEKQPEPNEESVGAVMMHYDTSCDLILSVGSGVINDIGKILAAVSAHKYMIVGTAPSMDGYASASSSMTRDGLKISLPSKSADVIVGDTEILCKAPIKMLKSGLGDMIAKYVSICEWRISHVINGEYYCEEIAGLVRTALKRCIDNAQGLLERDEKAVEAVFEGLVICGAAMALAGVSRPASGVEHYLSHVWDMRGLEFGTPVDFHGIQCAIGTLIAVQCYEKIRKQVPDREKALAYAEKFCVEEWNETLRSFLGKGAESMIALEKKEQKYNVEKHKERLEVIIEKWEDILQIMSEELPSYETLDRLMDTIEAPKTMKEIGLDEEILPLSFKATKDIRDKYVLSRLAWDLGIIDELF